MGSKQEVSKKEISIHAPRGGSDQYDTSGQIVQYEFQSTLPVGGATLELAAMAGLMEISIHAPRGGSDPYTWSFPGQASHFNPRSPWGERLFYQFDTLPVN